MWRDPALLHPPLHRSRHRNHERRLVLLPSPVDSGGGGYLPVIDTDINTECVEYTWVHLLGSTGDDVGVGIAHDSAGNTYISGWTAGQLPTAPETYAGGGSDAFIAKYSSDGTRKWVHLLGTSGNDGGTARGQQRGKRLPDRLHVRAAPQPQHP